MDLHVEWLKYVMYHVDNGYCRACGKAGCGQPVCSETSGVVMFRDMEVAAADAAVQYFRAPSGGICKVMPMNT
jgi:hypothetical protein